MAGVGKGGSVLFVDDERLIREIFGEALTAAGLDCSQAADGDQALAKLARRHFDAVVIDIIMPDREGIETIMQVRSRWPSTYIVAISGGGRVGPDEFLKLAAMVGADRTLKKPFTPTQLLEVLADGPPAAVALAEAKSSG
jgi:DNA-binding response OmpR family regulator